MNEIWQHIVNSLDDVKDKILQRLARKYIRPNQDLSEALVNLLGTKLADEDLDKNELMPLLMEVIPNVEATITQDLIATYERDFACQSYLEVLLLYRGFHAVTAYRLSHEFWKLEAYYTARWINKRISELYSVDIHPAAEIAGGLVIDHCLGIVIGETCKIDQNVFLFHNVTLGGTGRAAGDRHPKIRSNVVIGSGAIILGNITIGDHAVVAAGAVVLRDVAANTTVAGVPARVKGKANKLQ